MKVPGKKLPPQVSGEASCRQQAWRYEKLPLEGELTRLRAVGHMTSARNSKIYF